MLGVERSISTTRSAELFELAQRYEPLGVQGVMKYYPPYPLYVDHADGSKLYDVDGNVFIDYYAGGGPSVLGHNNREINEAVKDVLDNVGTCFCAPHPREIELAQTLATLVPSAEMSAFGCGGSDACLYAIRLARAVTDRPKIIKFEGGYQGWNDSLIVSTSPSLEEAGDPTFPNTVAQSAGILPGVLENTIVLPFNNANAVEETLRKNRGQVAAIIVEPIISGCCLLPQPGFLQSLRELCDADGVVLIFDEIITGFRLGLGGAQEMYGVTPDVTCLSKGMSNGWPISAVSGKRQFISALGPQGSAFFSGTFNGQVVSVAASLKCLEILQRPGVHDRLTRMGDWLRAEVNRTIESLGIDARCGGIGSIWTLYFADKELRDYRDLLEIAQNGGRAKDQAFCAWMMNHNVFIVPQKTSRALISASHSDDDIEETVRAIIGFLHEHRSALTKAS